MQCKALATAFPDDTVLPGTAAYAALNTYYLTNTAETPHCIFVPRTTRAVAEGLVELIRHNAVFAVRSGGHSYNPGFSSTSRGVVINLTKVNAGVRYATSGTAVIGSGDRWANVYRALELHGVTVSGARDAPVGVGGYTNGGGLNFELYREGFGTHTVVAYEVVLADGRVVTATRHGPHADLFRALKGSGAPFCIVTAFTFRTISLPDRRGVYGGLLTSGAASLGPVLDAAAEFTEPGAGTSDHYAHLITLITLYPTNATAKDTTTTGGVGTLVGNFFFYLTPEPTTPAVFRRIEAASRKGTVLSSTLGAPRSVSDITEELTASIGNRGMRSLLRPFTMRAPTRAMLHELQRIWNHEWAPLVGLPADRRISSLAATLLVIPLGRNVSSPENVMGMAPGVDYVLVAQMAKWRDAADDDAIQHVAHTAHSRCLAYLKKVGHYHPWM